MLDLATIFEQEQIPFELYHHRAIYTNEDALIIKAEQDFWGTETKSLYLKDKQGKPYIYFTFTTKKSDFKKLAAVVGKKLSIVAAEKMEEQTGQKAGAVSPFGYVEPTTLIIDAELLDQEKLVFAPGRPDQTMVVNVEELDKIIQTLSLDTFVLPKE